MRRTLLLIVLLVLIGALGFFAGSWWQNRQGAAGAPGAAASTTGGALETTTGRPATRAQPRASSRATAPAKAPATRYVRYEALATVEDWMAADESQRQAWLERMLAAVGRSGDDTAGLQLRAELDSRVNAWTPGGTDAMGRPSPVPDVQELVREQLQALSQGG